MDDRPFLWRLGLLLVVLAVVAALDRWRYRARATRWREYLVLLACGAVGGVLGAAIDQVTATISPDYFVLGKGLPAGAGFRRAVAWLGFQAGFVTGCIAGGLLLWAGQPERYRVQIGYRGLCRRLPLPVLGALLLAVPMGLVVPAWDPLGLGEVLAAELPPPRLARFLTVWGVHLGLYTGGVLGTLLGMLGLRRARQRSGA
jgi:hypothetical protein